LPCVTAKYNECEDDVPELRVLEEITQQPISSEDILNFELLALKRMGWKLNARTPVAFITAFCFAGVLHTFDSWDDIVTTTDMQANIFAESVALATVCLLDNSFKSHQASDVASAIIYWVRCKLGVCPCWRKELTDVSMCNPYTPGAMQVFNQIKALFPNEKISLVMPGQSPVTTSAAIGLSSVNTHRVARVGSPALIRSQSAAGSPIKPEGGSTSVFVTPTAVRVPSCNDLSLQTPLDHIISTTEYGAKVVGGKMVKNVDSEDAEEPSPVSIAF
jgi:hypothetical protein